MYPSPSPSHAWNSFRTRSSSQMEPVSLSASAVCDIFSLGEVLGLGRRHRYSSRSVPSVVARLAPHSRSRPIARRVPNLNSPRAPSRSRGERSMLSRSPPTRVYPAATRDDACRTHDGSRGIVATMMIITRKKARAPGAKTRRDSLRNAAGETSRDVSLSRTLFLFHKRYLRLYIYIIRELFVKKILPLDEENSLYSLAVYYSKFVTLRERVTRDFNRSFLSIKAVKIIEQIIITNIMAISRYILFLTHLAAATPIDPIVSGRERKSRGIGHSIERVSTARGTRVDDRSVGREEHSGSGRTYSAMYVAVGGEGGAAIAARVPSSCHRRVSRRRNSGERYLPYSVLSLSHSHSFARTEFVRRRRRRRSIFGRARRSDATRDLAPPIVCVRGI